MTPADPAEVFAVLLALGGDRGWFGSQWLWEVRGALDRLLGGPGLRRRRRDPVSLEVGDPVDFWRVEALEPGRLLRLHAEMRLPGDAWLTWELTPSGERGTRVVQTAEFMPRGVLGRLYWLAVAPFHRFVFPTLLRGITSAAHVGPAATTTGRSDAG